METVARRLQEMAFLNKGLTISLHDERLPVDEEDADAGRVRDRTFHYPGGLEDFVAHINATREPVHKKVISFDAKGESHGGRGRHAVEHRLHASRSTRSPTRSTRTRAAPTKRASAPR